MKSLDLHMSSPMRSNVVTMFWLKIGLFVVTFISGILLGHVWQRSCSPKDSNRRDVRPSEFQPSSRTASQLKFPRIFPVPRCTPKQKLADRDGICDFLRDYRMQERDRQTSLEIMSFFIKIATKHHWTYFLSYGSLLGSWRHHGIVPYDYDIDFYMDVRNRNEFASVIAKEKDYKIKIDARGMAHLYSESKGSQNILTQSSGRWKWPMVDLIFYKDNGTHINDVIYQGIQYPKKDIFPLHDRPFEGYALPAPHDPIRVLVPKYGHPTMDDCIAVGGMAYKCKQLKEVVPFVHREFKNGLMIETLKLGDKVIRQQRVQEEKSNLPRNPYTLETIVPKRVAPFPIDMIDQALVISQPIQDEKL